MERTLNRVELKGNVGSDPKIVHLESGATVMRFTLATNETFKGKDGNFREETTWHNITAWASKNLTDFERIKKGMFIEVIGKLRYSKYETKEGEVKNVTEIIAQKISLEETIS